MFPRESRAVQAPPTRSFFQVIFLETSHPPHGSQVLKQINQVLSVNPIVFCVVIYSILRFLMSNIVNHCQPRTAGLWRGDRKGTPHPGPAVYPPPPTPHIPLHTPPQQVHTPSSPLLYPFLAGHCDLWTNPTQPGKYFCFQIVDVRRLEEERSSHWR